MKYILKKILLYTFLLIFSQNIFVSNLLAQFSIEDFKKDAIGWGLWYGIGSITIDAPDDSASNETKGYTDVLPSDAKGKGFAIGISYGYFGINYGQDVGTIEINKYADIQQNSVSSDDVYVYEAKRVNRSIAILFQPVRYLYLGIGQDMGHFEFKQQTSAGVQETRKIAFEYSFYSCGIAIGFDPTKTTFAPIFVIYTKIPQSRDDYSSTVNGIGVGLYF